MGGSQRSPEKNRAVTRPFEAELSQAACDRATRIAKTLFGDVDAQVLLVSGAEVWRSRDPSDRSEAGPGIRHVVETGEAMWVEDGREAPGLRDHEMVLGPRALRFFAAHAIRLADGSVPGVLAVRGPRPRSYDPDVAGRLGDLADFIASEWERSKAAHAMAEALEAASRSEERLTLAMELSDIHVWEMDYARRELIKMGAAETFFTDPPTYMELFRDPFCTIDPRDRAEAEAAWAPRDRGEGVFRHEYRVRRSDDQEVWTSSVSRLIVDATGGANRLIGAMQNITSRKAAERALLEAKNAAEAASHAKSAFLAAMSHEIRTPLNGVLGMAQAMASGSLPPLQAERLQVIRQSGEALLTLLNDILDLSKIEAGKLELESVEFDVGDLARNVHAVYSAIARGKGVELSVTIEDGARGIYRGDAARARQILQNLTSNAVKFTDAGSVQIVITRAESGLNFEVTDTGIGVAPDRLPRLFQKFEQADVSTTRRYGGTGLGLAICRELADLFGGAIRVESEEGRGTSVHVFLPFEKVGDPDDARSPSEPGGCRQLGTIQVLAAEDNGVNQLVLRTLLNQVGVDPMIVSNGLEAVAAWREREWDVILMDVQMPVMDGAEASRTIRRLERQLGRTRTPIIALTANAMSHQVAAYAEAGMESFVAKPIEVEKLFAALDRALGDSAGEDQNPGRQRTAG